ncbi:MAG: DUF433 domain-containing protein [Chloroflexi bacterium]|nr:DUF433 domain-containing protein [Chloroflexota bacterium]
MNANRPAPRPVDADRLLWIRERMRRVPGIHFIEGTQGPDAVIAGTGITVWEVVEMDRSVGHRRAELVQALDWLTEEQLDAAFRYYAAYPEEVDQAIADNERACLELLAETSRHPA